MRLNAGEVPHDMGASIFRNGTVYLRHGCFVRADLGDYSLMSSTYQTPLKLFREGLDTVVIAAHLGCSEATDANLIHSAKGGIHDDG